MPLDSSGTQLLDYALTVVNPLAKMGIVPIAKALVTQYKKNYRVAWTTANPYSHVPGWKTVKHNPKRTLQSFLKEPLATRFFADDATAVPKKLAALALLVHQEIPDAQFSVDYFDVDPVLNVSINRTKWCLGIWDNGKLKCIAKQGVRHAT